jgi:hypothetical protein
VGPALLLEAERLEEAARGVVELVGDGAGRRVVVRPEDVIDDQRDRFYAVSLAVDLRDEPVAELRAAPLGVLDAHDAARGTLAVLSTDNGAKRPPAGEVRPMTEPEGHGARGHPRPKRD